MRKEKGKNHGNVKTTKNPGSHPKNPLRSPYPDVLAKQEKRAPCAVVLLCFLLFVVLLLACLRTKTQAGSQQQEEL